MADLQVYLRILGEICSEFCPPEKYCLLKEMVTTLKSSPRNLIQLKCIEKFKYIESQKIGKDIGWNDAGKLWAEQGYAEIYSKLYDENKRINDLYEEVMEAKKQENLKLPTLNVP